MADPAGRVLAGAGTGWWLEDAVPGTLIRHPHGRTIEETEHVWLAWVTHNLSDVHGDAHATARGPFGGPIVLGVLAVAIVIGLSEPGAPDAVLAVEALPAGWRRIRLAAPVRPGDTLRAESRIESVRGAQRGGLGIVTRTISGLDQAGTLVVEIQERDRVVAARPA